MRLKDYIGDADFYRKVLRVALPSALSELLLSCRSIIASIMVSSFGMVTAVGNANNVLNLHNYLLWGIEAGTLLFAAQYFGAGQYRNMARTQGICLSLSLLNAFFWNISTFLFGENILLFYLNDPAVMADSLIYLKLTMISLIPMCVTISIKCMYQAMHRTRLTFIESAIYVLINILSNYLFIFIFDLGIFGAGIAALFTEILCCAGMVVFVIRQKPVFLTGIKDIISFDLSFLRPFISKVLPIAFNEILFGFGQSLFNKAYGMLGSASMDVIYIGSEILSMALFIVWGYGSSVSILVGTLLGEGRIEQAKEESRYHLGLSFALGALLWSFMAFCSPVLLDLYHIDDPAVYQACRDLLSVYGLKAFLRVFTYVIFCTLKAGGDSRIYNLLDSGIMYAVGLPIAYAAVYFGLKNIVLVVLLCQIEQVVRLILCLRRYNSYKWAINLTETVN